MGHVLTRSILLPPVQKGATKWANFYLGDHQERLEISPLTASNIVLGRNSTSKVDWTFPPPSLLSYHLLLLLFHQKRLRRGTHRFFLSSLQASFDEVAENFFRLPQDPSGIGCQKPQIYTTDVRLSLKIR